ncbi:unnamed protein product, partial [Mesorhabditis spiculigera]
MRVDIGGFSPGPGMLCAQFDELDRPEAERLQLVHDLLCEGSASIDALFDRLEADQLMLFNANADFFSNFIRSRTHIFKYDTESGFCQNRTDGERRVITQFIRAVAAFPMRLIDHAGMNPVGRTITQLSAEHPFLGVNVSRNRMTVEEGTQVDRKVYEVLPEKVGLTPEQMLEQYAVNSEVEMRVEKMYLPKKLVNALATQTHSYYHGSAIAIRPAKSTKLLKGPLPTIAPIQVVDVKKTELSIELFATLARLGTHAKHHLEKLLAEVAKQPQGWHDFVYIGENLDSNAIAWQEDFILDRPHIFEAFVKPRKRMRLRSSAERRFFTTILKILDKETQQSATWLKEELVCHKEIGRDFHEYLEWLESQPVSRLKDKIGTVSSRMLLRHRDSKARLGAPEVDFVETATPVWSWPKPNIFEEVMGELDSIVKVDYLREDRQVLTTRLYGLLRFYRLHGLFLPDGQLEVFLPHCSRD